jgi:hypothetical protein
VAKEPTSGEKKKLREKDPKNFPSRLLCGEVTQPKGVSQKPSIALSKKRAQNRKGLETQ